MKKAQGMPFEVIIAAVILLIVATVVIVIFTTSTGDSQQILISNIDKLKDCDCDNIANFLDKCPCTPLTDGGKDGCPLGVDSNKDYSCFNEQGKCKTDCLGKQI